MYVVYKRGSGPVSRESDPVAEALGTADGDIAEDLKSMGYIPGFDIGKSELARIEMYNRLNPEARFAAIALVTLGETIDFYAFMTTEDAWDYLQKFVPTVKAMAELSQMTFD